MKEYERAILISPLGSNSSWLQGLILIFLELQRAAWSCMELHGGPLGLVVLGSLASFGAATTASLDCQGSECVNMCQAIRRFSEHLIVQACQDFVKHLSLGIVESGRCCVV